MISIHRKNYNLASVLTGDLIDWIRLNKDPPASRHLRHEYQSILRKFAIPFATYDYRNFISDVMEVVSDNPPPHQASDGWGACVTCACRCLNISLADFYRSDHGSMKYKSVVPNDILNPDICHWNSWKIFFHSLLTTVCNTTEGVMTMIFCRGYKIFFFSELCVITNGTQYFVGTHDMLLGVKTAVYSFASSLLHSKVATRLEKYPGVDFYGRTQAMLLAGLEDLKRYKNLVYDICKLVPSLALRQIIELEPDLRIQEFTNVIDTECDMWPDSSLILFFRRRLQTAYDVHILLELSGLCKAFGFPVIDM